jgi:hypothetical protein
MALCRLCGTVVCINGLQRRYPSRPGDHRRNGAGTDWSQSYDCSQYYQSHASACSDVYAGANIQRHGHAAPPADSNGRASRCHRHTDSCTYVNAYADFNIDVLPNAISADSDTCSTAPHGD